MKAQKVIGAIAAALLLPIGASHGQQPAPADTPRFVPGFSEFMLSAQARHTKLWLAGYAQNWELADYLIDEIKEGLEDAAKYVPTLKGLPVGQMIGSTMDTPIAEMEKVIKARDHSRFAASFDKLTEACNSCHQAASRPFIVVQRPTGPAYPNQSFAPAKR